MPTNTVILLRSLLSCPWSLRESTVRRSVATPRNLHHIDTGLQHIFPLTQTPASPACPETPAPASSRAARLHTGAMPDFARSHLLPHPHCPLTAAVLFSLTLFSLSSRPFYRAQFCLPAPIIIFHFCAYPDCYMPTLPHSLLTSHLLISLHHQLIQLHLCIPAFL